MEDAERQFKAQDLEQTLDDLQRAKQRQVILENLVKVNFDKGPIKKHIQGGSDEFSPLLQQEPSILR